MNQKILLTRKQEGRPTEDHLSTLQRWSWVALGYLWLVAAMGTFLRLVFFMPVEGVNYRFFLHGHSHVAFLGWVFNALMVGLLYAYLPGRVRSYRWLFLLFQVSVVGMLFSFPVQGYAAVSITFSTLHIFLSWFFTYRFLKDCRAEASHSETHALSLGFVRWGLFFMVLSAIGPFGLGVIMARGLADTYWYQLAIYFYLHFQYDGWFTFTVLGLFFWLLEKHKVPFDLRKARRFLRLMAVSCLVAYALSTLWTHPPVLVYGVGYAAAGLQAIALVVLMQLLFRCRAPLSGILVGWPGKLFVLSFMMFALKIVLQVVSAFPSIADLAYGVRNFTIGYLHLVFLGCITPFLLGWLVQTKLLAITTRFLAWGLGLLLVGFVASEAYLFIQPMLLMQGFDPIPLYYVALFTFSLCMVAGITVLISKAKRVPEEK